MRIVKLLALSVVALAFASRGAAETEVPVREFRSIALSNGGHVIVRHGAVHRVAIVTGDSQYTRIRVDDRQRLLIDRAEPCPRGYRLTVEVVTPYLSAVSVSNGGTVQTVGAFPAQPALDAAVEQGGRIDVRSLAADAVDASVYSGGGIFTTPRRQLTATVESGGAITYWGTNNVKKSVRDGGVVVRGAAEDADKPLVEHGPAVRSHHSH